MKTSSVRCVTCWVDMSCTAACSRKFAVVVSKAFGLPDPHVYGSGNPGATNVLRTGNRKAALLTLLGDGLKGFVAVYAAQQLAAPFGAPAIRWR